MKPQHRAGNAISIAKLPELSDKQLSSAKRVCFVFIAVCWCAATEIGTLFRPRSSGVGLCSGKTSTALRAGSRSSERASGALARQTDDPSMWTPERRAGSRGASRRSYRLDQCIDGAPAPHIQVSAILSYDGRRIALTISSNAAIGVEPGRTDCFLPSPPARRPNDHICSQALTSPRLGIFQTPLRLILEV
jgi:hypothetical protein